MLGTNDKFKKLVRPDPRYGVMTKRHSDMPAREEVAMERQLIRVTSPANTDGITAALRRAFRAAAEEPTDRDFEALLRRLN
jgi:hypothetical protein